MNESKETNKILKQILELLDKNERRTSANELTAETFELFAKTQKEGDEAAKKIQSSFDRIHDKLFNFNNMLIAAFLGLSKFPLDNPVFSLGMVVLPILNLIYLMFLEYWQMEIYRHSSQRMDWPNIDEGIKKYGDLVNRQNFRSLLAIFSTLGLFGFLVVKILFY